MRNNFWLISAFTVAATLSLGASPADAKKLKASHDPIGAYAINTQHCRAVAPAASKNWGWKNARLTAQFVKQDDGSYRADILPGAQNAHEKLPIASIAKYMTALVIFDLESQGKINLDHHIAVTKDSLCLTDNRFAVIGLPANIARIPGHDAMGQMIKISSNTMAVNLAVAASGNVDHFVALMNKKAQLWGMKNTHFVNPHGLPEGNRKAEYTTAEDMLIMAQHILPYMDRFKHYGNDDLGTWTLADKKKPNAIKTKLAALGAIFKTGTISQCSSLLTIAEQGDYKMADIQLCGKSATRFKNAFSTVSAAFSRLGDMVVPAAMADIPKTDALTPVSLSTHQDRSLNR